MGTIKENIKYGRQDASDEDIIALAKAELPKLENEFARDLVVWRLELRSVVAALRRRHRIHGWRRQGACWRPAKRSAWNGCC